MNWEWILIKRNCTGCGICADVCHTDAIQLEDYMAYPEAGEGKCTGCMVCYKECPFAAIEIKNF